MPTTRERLEVKVAEMQLFAAECDAKGERLSNADRQKLSNMTTEVNALVAQIKGQHAVDSLNGTGSASPYDAVAAHGGNAATADARRTAPEGLRGAELSAFNFSDKQIRELQANVLERRPAFMAAISAAEAEQANAPDYTSRVWPWLRDQTRLLDMIPKENTDRASVVYYRAGAAASAAATVAPGGAKPESTPTWTEETADVRKIAHYAKADDEVIKDVAGFINLLGAEMIAGLIDEENAQIATGDGTGTNLSGLVTAAGLTVGSAGTDLDAIADAWRALKMGSAKVDPDVIIMHPNDWFSTGFLLAKDTTGQYIVGNPVNGTTPRLWGIPVVVTESMTENSALVANLKAACTAYVREAPRFEVHPYGGGTDEFTHNQTLVRAEERLALAIHHPTAICKVTAV